MNLPYSDIEVGDGYVVCIGDSFAIVRSWESGKSVMIGSDQIQSEPGTLRGVAGMDGSPVIVGGYYSGLVGVDFEREQILWRGSHKGGLDRLIELGKERVLMSGEDSQVVDARTGRAVVSHLGNYHTHFCLGRWLNGRKWGENWVLTRDGEPLVQLPGELSEARIRCAGSVGNYIFIVQIGGSNVIHVVDAGCWELAHKIEVDGISSVTLMREIDGRGSCLIVGESPGPLATMFLLSEDLHLREVTTTHRLFPTKASRNGQWLVSLKGAVFDVVREEFVRQDWRDWPFHETTASWHPEG